MTSYLYLFLPKPSRVILGTWFVKGVRVCIEETHMIRPFRKEKKDGKDEWTLFLKRGDREEY